MLLAISTTILGGVGRGGGITCTPVFFVFLVDFILHTVYL